MGTLIIKGGKWHEGNQCSHKGSHIIYKVGNKGGAGKKNSVRGWGAKNI